MSYKIRVEVELDAPTESIARRLVEARLSIGFPWAERITIIDEVTS